MFGTPVAVALSVVFVVTAGIGASALARGARTGAPGGCGDTRSTELLHVVMSVAMIAMAWGLTGGPATPGGAAQVAVFSLAVVALAAVGVRDARRGRGREARGARLSHGLTAGATVWMVAAMPLLMAHVAEPMPATAGMAGMPGMDGTAHGGHAAMGTAPVVGGHGAGWAAAASTAVVAVLVIVGLAWVVRAFQLGSPAHRAFAHGGSAGTPVIVPAPRRAPDGVVARALAPVGGAAAPVAGVDADPATAIAIATATATDAAPGRTHGQSPEQTPAPGTASLAASCHALMSLGMAAMLAAML